MKSLPPVAEGKCVCACHDNVLKKPYAHDAKCCDKMNGFVEPSKEETVKDIAKRLGIVVQKGFATFEEGLSKEETNLPTSAKRSEPSKEAPSEGCEHAGFCAECGVEVRSLLETTKKEGEKKGEIKAYNAAKQFFNFTHDEDWKSWEVASELALREEAAQNSSL